MKFKLFILALLIACVFSTKIKDSKDDSKSLKKSRKDNTIDGFNLSGFHIIKMGNIKNDNNEIILSPNTKFNVKKVKNPESDYERIGLVFQFENFDSKLSSIMFPTEKKNEYFIPFRFIKSQPQFKESGFFFKNKSLELAITNDNDESFNINIMFPYKLMGSSIDFNQGVELANEVNLNRIKAIKSIKESLIELKKRTQELSLKNSIINQGKEKVHDAFVEKKKLNEKSVELKNLSDNLDKEIKKAEDNLYEIKSQLILSEQVLEGLKTKKITNNSEMKSIEKLQNDMNENNTEEAFRNLIAKMRNAAEIEGKEMENIIKNLQLQMLDRSSSLKNLESHIQRHEGVKTLDEFILSVTPRIDSKSNRKK